MEKNIYSKQKNSLFTIQSLVNALAIVSLLFNVVNPAIAAAQTQDPIQDLSSIPTTLEESPAGRLMGNNNEVSTDEMGNPDLVLTQTTITAYTSTPGQTDDSPFIAANGAHVHDGMIAANGLPFGTKVRIPDLYGNKVFTVEDRMNKRYGFGHFDVWLDTTRSEARKFGVKHLTVEIFYPEKTLAQK